MCEVCEVCETDLQSLRLRKASLCFSPPIRDSICKVCEVCEVCVRCVRCVRLTCSPSG